MKKLNYKLMENAFNNVDLEHGLKVIRSKQLTMSKYTTRFERIFAKKIGAKFALMVNSGSSANLLAVRAAFNPLRKIRFKIGDEAIIPSLLWSTSLWPLVQSGLKPVFVDIDVKTLNLDINLIKKKISNKTKVIMAIHVLGNSTQIEELKKICDRKKIILIEDTCEALGSKFKKKYLGTFGDFGTYSFYYSHHITCGEGGMIVCNNLNDYKILRSLRSHGWDRNPQDRKKKEPMGFNFINEGFNLRPTDIVASIAISQFKRFQKMNLIKNMNRSKIIKSLVSSKKWENQFSFIEKNNFVSPSWFGLPIIISKQFVNKKNKFLKYLNKKGIQTRPILSGNFLKQPSVKLFKLNKYNEKFKNAQFVEDRGFFIGLHSTKISQKQLDFLKDNLLKISSDIL